MSFNWSLTRVFLATRQGIIIAFIVTVLLFLCLNILLQYISGFRHDFSNVHRRVSQRNQQVYATELIIETITYDVRKRIETPALSFCEVIHIGLVCGGSKTNLLLHTMLKSLYFYRRNPLHFHIIVNKSSKKVLKVLFDTWNVPQVQVSFYKYDSLVPDIRWIPNTHYSGLYGLVKLMFPKLIPLNVTEKLIVLDTDVTFVSNILELWQFFESFTDNQAIGLVENLSDFYLSRSKWPADGRGFNTGVVLYNLKTLKKLGWNELWVPIAKKSASLYGASDLADQDILNAVIKQNLNLLFRIPCQWNTQRSLKTVSHECYNNQEIKVVHWNSPEKFDVKNKDSHYFHTIIDSFMELDGTLMRRQLNNCSQIVEDDTKIPIGVCIEFEKAETRKWRTLLFLRDFKYVPIKNDVTLIAQLSYDRLYMVEELCRYWTGPISLTFYVTDAELQQSLNFLDNSAILQDRTNIAYHAVFKEGLYYPINELRNVGLRYSNTPYVFLSDIDFLPMRNLYEHLRSYILSLKNLKKKALVIPAFETQRYKSKIPKSKRELLEMLDTKSIFTFRYDVWPIGHAPINYSRWRSARTPYTVKWQPDFEPYIVVEKGVVEYDRRFMGFGWNKVSHIMELEAQGYEFIVLPNAFIIHKPHAPSYDIRQFRTNSVYRMCLQNLKEDFVKRIHQKYGRLFDCKTDSFPITPS